MEMMVRKMKAMGDMNRFRILMMLTERSLCVCEILEVLDIAGGTLSNHLKILKNADLIEQEKEGRWVQYGLKDEGTKSFLKNLESDITDREVLDADREKIAHISKASCSRSLKTVEI